MGNNEVILTAKFNPVIKTYILLYVGFFLFISIIGIPLLIIWLLGAGQWYCRHYYEKLECELSRESLRLRRGILFTFEKTIPLENIQDLTFIEGPLLHHFNLCILKIETAGQGNIHGNKMSLIGIENARYFRQSVLEQRQIKMQDLRSSSPADSQLLADIKNTLERIEVLLQTPKS
jgi:putative membrane protein